MQIDYSRIWPYAISGLALLLIYRRLRRSFGPQLLRPAPMRIRIALLILLGGALVPAAFHSAQFLAAEAAGAVAGTALGIWGARHTRYASLRGRLHYVPHTYAGVAVSLLFIGRLIYRMVQWYSQTPEMGAMAAADPQGMASPSVAQSPATSCVIFVLVGYYVCYYAVVLWKSKHLRPEDLEAIAAPPQTATPSAAPE